MDKNSITAKIKDCLMSTNEAGAEYVKVDSLMDIEGWIDPEKAKTIFEEVVAHVKRLPAPFFDNGNGGGWTMLNLPFFDNGHGGPGEQWGGNFDAGALVVICSFYGIIQDPHKTLGFKSNSLHDMPGGVSYFSFNVQENFLNMVRHNLGLNKVIVL